MVLTEKERKVLRYLRCPLFEGMEGKGSPLNDLSNKEILSLYNKMDEIIEDERKVRYSLGNYDELFVLELSCVKDSLSRELFGRIGHKGKY